MAKEYALATVKGEKMSMPATQRTRLTITLSAWIRQVGGGGNPRGQLLSAMEDHVSDNNAEVVRTSRSGSLTYCELCSSLLIPVERAHEKKLPPSLLCSFSYYGDAPGRLSYVIRNTVSVSQRLNDSLSMNCLKSSVSSLSTAVMTRLSALSCSIRAFCLSEFCFAF